MSLSSTIITAVLTYQSSTDGLGQSLGRTYTLCTVYGASMYQTQLTKTGVYADISTFMSPAKCKVQLALDHAHRGVVHAAAPHTLKKEINCTPCS